MTTHGNAPERRDARGCRSHGGNELGKKDLPRRSFTQKRDAANLRWISFDPLRHPQRATVGQSNVTQPTVRLGRNGILTTLKGKGNPHYLAFREPRLTEAISASGINTKL